MNLNPVRVPGRGAACAVLAMVLVGSSVAVSGILATAPLCTAQAVRYALSAALLLVLARARQVRVPRPRGAEWLWLAGVAATGLVLFNIGVVRGVAGAQPATIAVAVACVPVLLGVFGPLLQGKRPSRRTVLAAIVVTAGAAGVEGAGHAGLHGVAWAVLTLACEAGFTLLAVPVLGRHGPWGVSVHTTWMGAVLFGVLGLVTEGPGAVTRLTAPDLLTVGYLALLVTVAAFLLWYSGVSALGPDRAGLLAGVAPVSAALCGLALGTRAPDPPMWAGIAVVAAGLAYGLGAPRRVRTPGPVSPGRGRLPAGRPGAGPAAGHRGTGHRGRARTGASRRLPGSRPSDSSGSPAGCRPPGRS